MWRRPLEWNLNGTTDPRDGSVDHLSLNSLSVLRLLKRPPRPYPCTKVAISACGEGQAENAAPRALPHDLRVAAGRTRRAKRSGSPPHPQADRRATPRPRLEYGPAVR